MNCCKPKVRNTSVDLKNGVTPKVQTAKKSGSKIVENTQKKQEITVIPLDNTSELFDQEQYVQDVSFKPGQGFSVVPITGQGAILAANDLKVKDTKIVPYKSNWNGVTPRGKINNEDLYVKTGNAQAVATPSAELPEQKIRGQHQTSQKFVTQQKVAPQQKVAKAKNSSTKFSTVPQAKVNAPKAQFKAPQAQVTAPKVPVVQSTKVPIVKGAKIKSPRAPLEPPSARVQNAQNLAYQQSAPASKQTYVPKQSQARVQPKSPIRAPKAPLGANAFSTAPNAQTYNIPAKAVSPSRAMRSGGQPQVQNDASYFNQKQRPISNY